MHFPPFATRPLPQRLSFVWLPQYTASRRFLPTTGHRFQVIVIAVLIFWSVVYYQAPLLNIWLLFRVKSFPEIVGGLNFVIFLLCVKNTDKVRPPFLWSTALWFYIPTAHIRRHATYVFCWPLHHQHMPALSNDSLPTFVEELPLRGSIAEVRGSILADSQLEYSLRSLSFSPHL